MSNDPFSEMRPRLTALTQAASGNAMRAQQALVTFLFSAAQAQFDFSRGLAEDVTQALKEDPAAGLPVLMGKWHDRSEQMIGMLRQIGDDMRGALYEAVAEPLTAAGAAAAQTAEDAPEVTKSADQPEQAH